MSTEPSASPPSLDGVLETVLYYPAEKEDRIERFYRDLLGMRPIGRKEGQFLFFRIGAGVFLLFNPERSLAQDSPPPHGASGPGHACLRVPPASYQDWKAYLDRHGVEVEEEVEWPGGGRSFYFRDPAGNALEIANGDIWPS